MVSKILSQESSTIQVLAEILGVLVSTFPGVELGPLYYRKAESLKIQALKYARGDFAARLTLTSNVSSKLQLWLGIAYMLLKQMSLDQLTNICEVMHRN